MKTQGTIIKVIKPLLLIILTAYINTAISQTPTVQDCLGAIPVCQDIYYEPNVYSGTGNYTNEIYNTPGDCTYDCPGSCMDGEQNSVWYIFTIQEAGLLSFSIIPDVATDDYDWAVYDITLYRCEDIYSQYMSMQSSCNAAGGPGYQGSTGVSSSNGGTTNCSNCGSTNKWNANISVISGKTYVLCVSNWMGAGANGGFTLNFSASTAVIYDNVRPEISHVYNNNITCSDSTFEFKFTENVMCASVTPTSLNFTGPGSTYTITNVFGETCDVGGEMENTYTLTIDPPFSVNGSYSLNVVQFSGISDACGNIALPQQFPFDIDLGAPEIDESNMEISNSTCGQSNGTITGLVITGTPPFTYEWTDAGNIVGTDLDLINVSAGLYTLTVRDENTCESFGGPYQINDEGAPVIDVTNMIITDNYCGMNDGSITGIEATGSTTLSYEWIDDNSNVIGTEVDLINMPDGTYILKVFDENSCEAFSSPFTIEDKPGPVIDEINMDISNASCNENTGSITNILVGGNGLTFEWTDEFNNIMGNSVDLFNVGPGNYSLKINNENDCEVILGPYEIINIGGVTLNAVNSQNPTCELNNGTIEINAIGGYGNRWYSIDVDTLWTDNGLFENLSSGTYNVLVKDDYDCIMPYPDNPIILENMGAQIIVTATGNTPVCSEDNLLLNCNFNGANYLWQGPNGYTSNEQNPVINNIALTDAGTYTLIATTTPYNCADTSEIEIEVLQRHELDVNISASQNPISPGELVEFTASAPEAGNGALYVWTVENDIWQEDYDSTFISNEIYNTSYVNCIVTSSAPCTFPNPSQSVNLLLEVLQARVFLPNSFNPNSIHGNEIFKVKTLTADLIDFQMYIYTKWGQKIFNTTDNNIGWNGTINGEPAPAGVYVWVVKYSDFGESNEAGTVVTKKGTVTLVR